MNFFEHQAAARRNTSVLVAMFVLAVVAIVIAVDLLLGVVVFFVMMETGTRPGEALFGVHRGVYVWGAVITLLLILVASAVRMVKLMEGGSAIARLAGARAVSRETRDPLERRYINVVDEMAIASGVRVPKIYVMDGEKGVNAFAAGYNLSDTVVAVTRGALETLNRDELQGVIGHEFSHILHGDMGLNTKMMGVLAGIVFIGAIGQFIMRSAPEAEDLRATIALFVLGLLVFAIGAIGLLFARMIKAAVSRQREFLADAASVQFTRNPDGIAGALDRIKASGRGTLVSNRYAEDMSHMFFGGSIKVAVEGLLDTHPPIEERIKRVNPRFQPKNYRSARAPEAPGSEADEAEVADERKQVAAGVLATVAAVAPAAGRRAADQGERWQRSPQESADLVGTVDGDKVDFAARLMHAIPADLRAKLNDPEAARAVVVALLLAPPGAVMQAQLDALKAAGLDWLGARASTLAPQAQALGPEFRFALIDLAMSAMRGLGPDTRRELIAGLEVVIHADRRVTVHEFIVLTLVRDQLLPAKARPAANRRIADLGAECAIVLSLVAHAGIRPDATGVRLEDLKAALAAGAKEIGIPEPAPDTADLDLAAAALALQALKSLAPMQKALLIKGLFAAITADGTIRILEAELLRLAGAVFDCPLPPLLTESDPAALAA